MSSNCLPFLANSTHVTQFKAIRAISDILASHIPPFHHLQPFQPFRTMSSHFQPFQAISSHFHPLSSILVISSYFQQFLASLVNFLQFIATGSHYTLFHPILDYLSLLQPITRISAFSSHLQSIST